MGDEYVAVDAELILTMVETQGQIIARLEHLTEILAGIQSKLEEIQGD